MRWKLGLQSWWVVFPESFCTFVLCLNGRKQAEMSTGEVWPGRRNSGKSGKWKDVRSLESGKTSFKEDTGKKRSKPSEPSSTSSAMLKKRGHLEDFGFEQGSSESQRPKVLKLFSSFTNETPTGLLSKSRNLQKQANKEKASTIWKFNPKWKEEFPWLLFNAEKQMWWFATCTVQIQV